MVFLPYGHRIMNKSELIDFLSEKFKHLPSREIEKMFEKIISSFSDSLANGDRIEIRNFGSFSIKQREKREARNPKSGEKIFVGSKKSIHFRSSKIMKKILNEK
ncbi:MAG: integration host factor subunit beta [Rickettsiales bacterium]|nr:integration host factor subunit beta [Rickettsiales bacterium]